MDTRLSQLEEKAWYRLLKVLYIAAFIFCFIIVIGISWSSIPKQHVDTSFTFSCFYEKSTPTNASLGDKQYDFSMPPNHKLSDILLFPTGSREKEASKIDQAMKNYCLQHANNSLYWFSYPNTITGASDDPSFNLKYALRNNNTGSWQKVISDLVIGFAIEILIFALIRWVFLYVVTGKKTG